MHDCQQETRIALMEQGMKDIKEDVKLILGAVVGNGKPGLNMRVDRLEHILWIVFAIGTFAGGIGGYIIKGFFS